MKPAYRLTLLMVSAFGLGLLAGHGVNLRNSMAQGYDGVIAPQPGYKEKTTQQQPAYPGVIAGPDAPAPRAAQAPLSEHNTFLPPSSPTTTANMTPKPGSVPPRPVGSVDDIKMAALAKPLRIDWKNAEIPPQLVDTLSGLLTPNQKETLAKPLYRINGMLPEEFGTKQKIDSIMAIVENPAATAKERKVNARKASESLIKHANYLQARKDIPVSVFKTMGMPDSYAKQENEGVSKSLKRVEAAIKTLRKYE